MVLDTRVSWMCIPNPQHLDNQLNSNKTPTKPETNTSQAIPHHHPPLSSSFCPHTAGAFLHLLSAMTSISTSVLKYSPGLLTVVDEDMASRFCCCRRGRRCTLRIQRRREMRQRRRWVAGRDGVGWRLCRGCWLCCCGSFYGGTWWPSLEGLRFDLF